MISKTGCIHKSLSNDQSLGIKPVQAARYQKNEKKAELVRNVMEARSLLISVKLDTTLDCHRGSKHITETNTRKNTKKLSIGVIMKRNVFLSYAPCFVFPCRYYRWLYKQYCLRYFLHCIIM